MKQELALHYYPTSVALIDDSESFLLNLKQILKLKIPQFRCATFCNPKEALKYTNDQYMPDVISGFENSDFMGDADDFVKKTLDQSLKFKDRNTNNSEISVVVVDLDMPGLNGLEFCRRITNPNIKKILLTGIATEEEVFNAFNNNEIHYYIKKSQNNMEELLERAIRKMQRQYFLDISVNFKSNALDESAKHFSDAVFADYFETLCVTLDVVEYHYCSGPSRYKLRLRNNDEIDLLVYSDDDLQQHFEIMKEESAPKEVIDLLGTWKFIPNFPTLDGFYINSIKDYKKYFYPAQYVPGEFGRYFCAIVGGQLPDDLRYFSMLDGGSSTAH